MKTFKGEPWKWKQMQKSRTVKMPKIPKGTWPVSVINWTNFVALGLKSGQTVIICEILFPQKVGPTPKQPRNRQQRRRKHTLESLGHEVFWNGRKAVLMDGCFHGGPPVSLALHVSVFIPSRCVCREKSGDGEVVAEGSMCKPVPCIRS